MRPRRRLSKRSRHLEKRRAFPTQNKREPSNLLISRGKEPSLFYGQHSRVLSFGRWKIWNFAHLSRSILGSCRPVTSFASASPTVEESRRWRAQLALYLSRSKHAEQVKMAAEQVCIASLPTGAARDVAARCARRDARSERA